MRPTARRLIVLWVVGALLGVAAIGITSPLFVRSYAPLEANAVRGVWTLPSGRNYRWRSEGYADTRIGPLGMPGKRTLGDGGDQVIAVALWGDSQAEGVCVRDDEKIFAQAERLAADRSAAKLRLNVFPLARSGEQAADWLTQLPRVERELSIDVHVLLITELPDLISAPEAPLAPPSEADVERANAAIAARLPAFVIQAARRVLTEADDATPRRLRFSIGPVAATEPAAANGDNAATDWPAVMAAIRQASTQPMVILYAPQTPLIIDGRIVADDRDADQFAEMQTAAEAVGLIVVDAGQSLRRSAAAGDWPHGFHNGYIGQGHLNAVGNRLVAERLVAAALAASGRED